MAARIRFGFTDDDIWVAGSTRNLIVPVTDASGAALDLTGATAADFRLTNISSIEGTPTVLLTKSLGSGTSVTGTGNSQVTIAFSKADSLNLVGDYHGELRVVDAASNTESVTLLEIRITPTLFDS